MALYCTGVSDLCGYGFYGVQKGGNSLGTHDGDRGRAGFLGAAYPCSTDSATRYTVYGCFTVVLIGITCPAITVGTVYKL